MVWNQYGQGSATGRTEQRPVQSVDMGNGHIAGFTGGRDTKQHQRLYICHLCDIHVGVVGRCLYCYQTDEGAARISECGAGVPLSDSSMCGAVPDSLWDGYVSRTEKLCGWLPGQQWIHG